MNEDCCPSLKTLSISYWSVTQLHRSEARCVYNLLSSEASLNYFTFICAYSSHTFLDRSNLIFMPLTMLFMPPVFFFCPILWCIIDSDQWELGTMLPCYSRIELSCFALADVLISRLSFVYLKLSLKS